MNTNTSPYGDEPRSGIVDKVREGATAQLSTQKDKATDGLGAVAQAVRQTTQSLRDQQHDTVAQYVERAADQIERFSEQLKGKDVNELLNDAQRLARRKPAVFIGGAFALGLVGARFLKSSSPHQHDTRMYDSGGPSGSYGSTAYVTGGTTRAYTPATPVTPPTSTTPITPARPVGGGLGEPGGF